MMIEIIGIISTIFILLSMLFTTTTIKGSIFMRSLNIIGSIFFTIYGCLLPAISTSILNGALIIVNSYHLVTLIKESKKQQKQNNKTLKNNISTEN